MEGDHVHWVWQISELRVNDVLEELAKSIVEGIKVDSAMDDSHKSVVLIDGQVFYHLSIIRLTKLIHLALDDY